MRIAHTSHHRRWKVHARSALWARKLARRGHEVALICTANMKRLRLLTRAEMALFFPDACIVSKYLMGLSEPIVAGRLSGAVTAPSAFQLLRPLAQE